jgi:hypothetical protein
MKALASLAAAALLLLAFAAPVLAREEIRSFASAVTVLTSGAVDVTETIEVNSEGDEIRHGIFRDIPTILVNPDNSRLRSSLNVVSVSRDGRPEPYDVEGLGTNARRIRIGDADTFLSDGIHRYVIRYTMTRMVRFFPDHDELFWNATGNYWDFPILRATATVRLPDGAVISDLAVYTGVVGSPAADATTERVSDGLATFRATGTLAPGEGMTVAVAFQKGIVPEPSGTQALLYWFSDHRDLLLPGFAVLIVLLYNFFAWDAVGRDPRKGTIIPLFHAPKGFSPALVHYIHQMGWKNSGWTAFTASIFNLGVKGLLQVDQPEKTLTVTVTGKRPEEPLPPGERVLFSFFSGKGKLTIDRSNGASVNTKRSEMISAIETENRRAWFNNNTGYVIGGAVLSLVLLFSLLLFDTLEPVWLIAAVAVGLGIGLFSTIFRTMWSGSGFSRFIIVIWIVIAAGNFAGGFASWFQSFSINTGMLAAASIVIIDILFAVLLRAPTTQGRRVMDQIEGFRMYLDTAEKERLNMQGEPQMTVKRFEAILPFAIALGVEKPWSEHFERELARNAVPDATGGVYVPLWYTGRDFSSSSSGFGGGGGSGGGGGGGGGGGW